MSGIVSNTGRITISSGLFEKSMLCGKIYVKENAAKTPYTKYKDWFAFFILLFFGAAAFLKAKK